MTKVDALAPGAGYVDLTAAVAGVGLSAPELRARAELGWKPTANSSLFAFSEADLGWNQPLGYEAGIGFRANW